MAAKHNPEHINKYMDCRDFNITSKQFCHFNDMYLEKNIKDVQTNVPDRGKSKPTGKLVAGPCLTKTHTHVVDAGLSQSLMHETGNQTGSL
jgi:hypothetical protein